MRVRILVGIVGLFALGLAGCSMVAVQTDFDPAASFSTYESYSLAPPPEAVTLSPSVDAALRDTLRASLASRGIEETGHDAADLDIVWHVITQQKYSVDQYTQWGYTRGGGWPGQYGPYGMWTGAPVTYTDVDTYLEGTLVLDFVDTKTEKLVFRGSGTGVVGSPKSNAKRVRKAVEKIVSDFPAASGN